MPTATPKRGFQKPLGTERPRDFYPLYNAMLDVVDNLVVDTVTTVAVTGHYTLVLTNQDKTLEVNSASGVNVTVPPNSSVAFPIGTIVTFYQQGTGAITFVAGSGVTIRTPTTLVSGAQHATLSLRKRATNEWVLAGLTT